MRYFKMSKLISKNEQSAVEEKPYIVLGYMNKTNGNSFEAYFFVPESRRVMVFTPSQFKGKHLKWIAPDSYWRTHFGTDDKRMKSGVCWKNVKKQLIKELNEVGEYQGVFYSQGQQTTIPKPKKNIKVTAVTTSEFFREFKAFRELTA